MATFWVLFSGTFGSNPKFVFYNIVPLTHKITDVTFSLFGKTVLWAWERVFAPSICDICYVFFNVTFTRTQKYTSENFKIFPSFGSHILGGLVPNPRTSRFNVQMQHRKKTVRVLFSRNLYALSHLQRLTIFASFKLIRI